jgi:serine/threonine protein phosphatase PrpC
MTPKTAKITEDFRSGKIHIDFLLLSLGQFEQAEMDLRVSLLQLSSDWRKRSAKGGPESLLLAADELWELLNKP